MDTCFTGRDLLAPLLNRFASALTAAADREVLIVYHADPDGVAAAALVASALHRPLRVHTYAIGTHEFDFTTLVSDVRAAAPGLVIMLDVNIFSRPGAFEDLALAAECQVVVYDDHAIAVERVAVPRNCIYLNPSLDNEPDVPLPSCFFSWEFLNSQYEDPAEVSEASEWLLHVGLHGESVLPAYEKALRFRTPSPQSVRQISSWIYSYYARLDLPRPDDLCLELLATWEQYGSADEARAQLTLLRDVADATRKEIASALSSAVVERTSTETLTLVDATAPLTSVRVANLLASEVRNREGTRAVALGVQELPGHERVMVELRRTQDLSIDLARVVDEVAKSTSLLNWGGHPPAAGLACAPGALAACREAIYSSIARAAAQAP